MSGTVMSEDERQVQSALANGAFEEAQEALAGRGRDIRPLYRAIFEAAAALALEDRQRAWQAIARGLKIDGHDYELYMMLGDLYAAENPRQAYLCYENALFYCDVPEDREQIRGVIGHLRSQGGYVPRTAVVIPFRDWREMTGECLESVVRTTPDTAREIILVDDGSAGDSSTWLKEYGDIKVVRCGESGGFAAACNQGIRLAEADADIFLLNNDTLLTDNALFWLRMGLYESELTGSAGCVTNNAPNFQTVIEDGKTREEYYAFARGNNIPGEHSHLNKFLLSGYALLLKRSVLDRVGLLDERFSPGGFEDNDICMRINLAGYRNVLCKNSFIIHWGGRTFGREPQRYGEILAANQKKFFEKWSSIRLEPEGYWNTRMDLVTLLRDKHEISDEAIMVVGTGCGGILSCLQEMFPDARLYGMERHQYMAQIADKVADTVWADYEKWKGDELEDTFSYILINDVLEQVAQPIALLTELKKMLKKDGHLVVSFANRWHFSRIMNRGPRQALDRDQVSKMLSAAKYMEGEWVYTQSGDRTAELEYRVGELQIRYPQIEETEFYAYRWVGMAEEQRTDIQFGAKLVMSVPTCDHPESVEDVLARYAEVYHRYGLDLYYYDSSSDGRTKEVIQNYRDMGYDNLYYIPVDPLRPVPTKIERIMTLDGIQKEYEYMWLLKDRCGAGEKFLQLLYRAMEEPHDLIFKDNGAESSEQELLMCRDVDEFYHKCGTWATNMGNAIYHVKSMLRGDFDMTEFYNRHGEYKKQFPHFLIIFEQLAKKRDPNICLLAGKNIALYQSGKSTSSWHEERIYVWGTLWIQANEILPECYTRREDVIKQTASLPWILDDIGALVDLHDKGILTPEYYQEIKGFWTRVSNIPLATLRQIAEGEYCYQRDPMQLKQRASGTMRLLLQAYEAVLEGKDFRETVSAGELLGVVKRRSAAQGPGGVLLQGMLDNALNNLEKLMEDNAADQERTLSLLQIVIGMLVLIER